MNPPLNPLDACLKSEVEKQIGDRVSVLSDDERTVVADKAMGACLEHVDPLVRQIKEIRDGSMSMDQGRAAMNLISIRIVNGFVATTIAHNRQVH